MSEVKLTKSVPLAIIIGLFAQAGGLIWYMSSLDSRVSSNEEELMDRKEWMVSRERFEREQATQMVRLTMSITHLAGTTSELKTAVRELTDK